MWSIILLILISLLVFASTAVSNESKLFNKKEKRYKKLTNTGWIVLVINLVIISLSIGQYKLGENEITQRDSLQRKSYTESVEQITKNANKNAFKLKYTYDTTSLRLKSRYDTSTINIIAALAKYGLKYDSAKKMVDKLSKISSIPDPVVQLAAENEVKLTDSVSGHYQINIESVDAASTGFEIKLYFIVEFDNENFKYLGEANPFSKHIIIAKDQEYSTGIYFKLKFKNLFILMVGTYYNSDMTKKFNLNSLNVFNYEKKQTTSPAGNYEVRIRAKFESIPKNINVPEVVK